MSLSLIAGFREQGFEITSQEALYTVKDSESLARRGAVEIVLAQKYCPIMSPHRRGGQLQFTVVPYKKPDTFTRPECESTGIPSEELWRLVEAVKSLAGKEDAPIYLKGDLTYKSLSEGKRDMLVRASFDMCSLVVDYVYEAPSKGKALDLGCGRGVNSIPFLKKGWTVTAIDYSVEALDLFRASVPEEHKGQFTLTHADITTSEFPSENYDLVLCMDVLPYISSSAMRSVLQKIHAALVPGGRFIGTIFFSPSGTKGSNADRVIVSLSVEMMSKLGAHLYPEPSIVPAMLEDVGFHVDECSFRRDPTLVEPVCVQFVATKPLLKS